MSEKRSSFHMGNEFNGFAEKVYLKAERNEVPPISQENAKITPDYSQFALKTIGAMPVVLDPENMDSIMKKMLGCLPVVNQVVIDKNEADGSYQTSVHVAAGGFTANAYPTYVAKTEKYGLITKNYFIVTKNTNLSIRESASQNSKELAKGKRGAEIKVYTNNGHKKNEGYHWINVNYKGTIGWVPKEYLRPDKIRLEEFKDLIGKEINVKIIKKETKKEDIKTNNPLQNWYEIGGYDYENKTGYKGPCQKVYGGWCVAVGPKILDIKYKDEGELNELVGFSKLIKVCLKLKRKYRSSGLSKNIILDCYVADLKAHTYNKYPYEKYNIKSDYVTYADAMITNIKGKRKSKKIRNGIVQTGIRYPLANNGGVVNVGQRGGKVIEFCGESIPGLDYLDKYELVHIETNFEKKTRGENFIQPWK